MERQRKKGGTRLLKNEPKERTKKEKVRLAVIFALVVLFAILVTLFAVYRAWAKAPDLPSGKPPVQSGQPTSDPNQEVSGIEGVGTAGDRKKNYYTFLVVGRDTGGGGNTDTILLFFL